jgi:ribonuclease-3
MSNTNENKKYEQLEELLSYSFKNRSLLLEALTHRSYSHEKRTKTNYERLEFLGDAVLQLVITEYLLEKYRDYDEGTLSKLRGYFVSEGFLSVIANEIGLGRFVLLGKGEKASGGMFKDSLLCDIFESVVAAIYRDGGYEIARETIINLFGKRIDEDISTNSFIDSKSELQKYTQKAYGILPEYTVLREVGPEHSKTFVVELTIDGILCERGEGKSKKNAEKSAASKALNRLGDDI